MIHAVSASKDKKLSKMQNAGIIFIADNAFVKLILLIAQNVLGMKDIMAQGMTD